MSKYKKGKIVRGTVTGIETYGVFVSFDEYYSGLIHISEISHNFVNNIHDHVNIGDIINVEILEVDEQSSHLKLSIKNIKYKHNAAIKRAKIIETPKGFATLNYRLPLWIDESVKKIKNTWNGLDK